EETGSTFYVEQKNYPHDGEGKPWKMVMAMENPQIRIYHNVLSETECDQLIELSKSKLKRSTTVDNLTGETQPHPHRTSQGAFFAVKETDFITSLDTRIAELMNVPIENGEGIQILNYQTGGEYKPHFDYFPPEKSGSALHTKHGGQRIATLIMYL